jgi:hypothetical protein
LSVRSTALIVCDIVGGHCRVAHPITRCGSPTTSFDAALALPTASSARTTMYARRALSSPVIVNAVPLTGPALCVVDLEGRFRSGLGAASLVIDANGAPSHEELAESPDPGGRAGRSGHRPRGRRPSRTRR